MIQHATLVALGGALGAVLRYSLGLALETNDFPLVHICSQYLWLSNTGDTFGNGRQ